MFSLPKIFKRATVAVPEKDEGISFSEWYRLAAETVDRGSFEDLDSRLWESFPDNYSSDNDPLLADVMSKLETGFLQYSVKRFTNRWNHGIENADITEMRLAWSDMTIAAERAWSLIDREHFPGYLSNDLDKQLIGTIGSIQDNIEITTKKAADETMSPILRNAYYMVVKQRLSNIWSIEYV